MTATKPYNHYFTSSETSLKQLSFPRRQECMEYRNSLGQFNSIDSNEIAHVWAHVISGHYEGITTGVDENTIWKDSDSESERMEVLLWELYENCNEENWDCYGASPIEEAIIHRTIMFVKKVSDTFLGKLTTDNFCPNPHGTITIEFSSKMKYIQAEIGLTKINIIGELGANEGFAWENVDINTQNMVVFDKILSLVYLG